MPGNSGSRSGTGGGERGSVGGYSWHIGAARRRPLTSPCLPPPLAPPLAPSVSRYLSPSHLSIPPLFPLTQPGVSASLPLVRPFPRVFLLFVAHYPCEPTHTRTHARTHTHSLSLSLARTRPLHRLFPLSCLLVWFRSRPFPLRPPPSPAPLRSSRWRCFSFPRSLICSVVVPRPRRRRRCSPLRPAFIPQQKLRDCSSGRRR